MIWDILDDLDLAHFQLHPTVGRILLSCCIVWHQVLESADEKYPNLTTWDLFYIHGILHFDRNLSSFRSWTKCRVVHLVTHYSHAKDWHKKYFFVFGLGWEYLVVEGSHQEFLVRAVWGVILEDREFNVVPSTLKEAHIQQVYSWVR